MDPGTFVGFHFDWAFVYGLLTIIIIDLILSGDNAVLIAMAVRSLPAEQRKKGFMLGAAAAVILRIGLTFFIAQLLQVPYLKLIGGILILWIAVKLFMEGAPGGETDREPTTIFQAMKLMVIADLTMSIDNMLAVAGASHGSLLLLLVGLGLSIPFLIFTSGLLAMLMDRFPIIIYIGAAILGRVGGEMIMTDPAVVGLLHPSTLTRYGVEVFFAVGVIAAGKLVLRHMIRAEQKRAEAEAQSGENRKE